ncbi:MAG: hypothetical protein Phyf2KO_23370 [Phycisphaerales bacterium]
MEIINTLLRRAWWRLVLIDMIRTFAVSLTVVAGLLVVWRLLESVVSVPTTWGVMAGVGAGVAFVFSVAWSIVRTKQGGPVARQLDERAGLRETISTALCVQHEQDAWSRATVEMAGQKAQSVNLREAIPVESPRYWPAPVAAMALLGILMMVPVIDLPSLFGSAPTEISEEGEAELASVEVEEMKRELEAEAKRLGVDIDLGDEAADDALKPEDMTPEEIQAAAVKQLTQLTDKLEAKMEEQGKDKLEAMKNQLQKLRQPGPGPAEELARAMARGNFDKAREELSKLAQQMRSGEMSEEQQDQLEKQMENLAKQMEELAEQRQETERSLREAGMSSEEAKQLAANPEALQKALEQMQNLTQEQKEQLMQQAQSQAEACKQCQNMGQAMSQMAKSMSQGQQGMSSQAQAAMDQMGDMLSEMEQLQGDMQSMQAMMNAAQQQMDKMGQGFGNGMGSGMGEWRTGDTSRLGSGSGGPGKGDGASPDAKETSISFNDTKANVNTQQGPIIGSRMVYEGQIRGESRIEFAMGAKSAASNASDAIESMQVPREYESAVMKYFGALEDRAETATDSDSEDDSSDE